MNKKRIGLIGAGSRGTWLMKLLLEMRPGWECAAMVDPRPESPQKLAQTIGYVPPLAATSFDRLRGAEKVDAWIMAAHESAHLDAARFLFPLGKPIYFEKPIAITIEQGQEIMRLQRHHKTQVMVGYECRWAPFYAKSREIIRSGRLGKILNIAAEERLEGEFFAAGWLRGNWRRESASGSLLLTKCCHDMDYLPWLAGAAPTHVSSFGGRMTFLPEPRATPTCRPCPIRSACNYSPEKIKFTWPWGNQRPGNEDMECVYNSTSDVVDHQEVQLLFPGGLHASFIVTAPYARSERSLVIAGTEAWLEGNLEDGKLTLVPCHGGAPEAVDLAGVRGDSHGGGDVRIIADFVRWIENPASKPEATLEDGFRSLAIVCAADESRRKLQTMEMKKFLG